MRTAWLHPPFRLPADAWVRLDRALAHKPPHDVDWLALRSLDTDIHDSIAAERRALRAPDDPRRAALSDPRRAWLITSEADLLIAGDGVQSWLSSCAQLPLADETVAAYDLFGEHALAQRLRGALAIFRVPGTDDRLDEKTRRRISDLDTRVSNPQGDASAGRLHYAHAHRSEFFLEG